MILHSQNQTVIGKYVSKDKIYKIKDLVVFENISDDLNKI
jgi:hypothetical protein